jgi:hypothetical protein
METTDILMDMRELLESNIKQALMKPYYVKSYNGAGKTIGGNQIISPSISNTGNLASQIQVKIDSFDDGVALYVDFGSADNYAYFVEYGRRPGKYAPFSVIDKWMLQRGLSGTRDKKGRFIKRKALRFLINRSIKQHGYSGRYFLKTAVDKSLESILEKYGEVAEQFIIDYFESTGIIGEYFNTKEDTRFQRRVL